jgi:hypothetical protein
LGLGKFQSFAGIRKDKQTVHAGLDVEVDELVERAFVDLVVRHQRRRRHGPDLEPSRLGAVNKELLAVRLGLSHAKSSSFEKVSSRLQHC